MNHQIFRMVISVCLVMLLMIVASPSIAELEGLTPTGGANVTTRKCVGGANEGALCNDDNDCASLNCFDYNLFDLTVNFLEDDGTGFCP